MFRQLFLTLLLTLVLAGSLQAATMPAGVLATVNGTPITLRQVEAMYDATAATLAFGQNPSLELLQQQYGSNLLTLIGNILIMDELKLRGLEVGQEELAVAEAAIRQDYTQLDFEKSLQEEYIDLSLWREQLLYSLSLAKFQEKILRPSINISKDEVLAKYKPELFKEPAKIELIWLQYHDKAALEIARKLWVDKKQLPAPGTDQIFQETLRLSPDRLPENMRKSLVKLKFQEATPLCQEAGDYHFAIFLQDVPAKVLNPAEAYPIIEEELVDQKSEQAKTVWLEQALKKASIQVNTDLLPKPAETQQ